jgi:hypothetical protein
VAVDLERMLARVVAEVFDDTFDTTYTRDSEHDPQVTLRSPNGGARSAGLRATHEWFEITVPDLGVGATLTDYDSDESQKEAILRELALVARGYLSAEGRVEHRRGLLRKHPVLTITVNDREWKLGRRSSIVHYP